MSGVLFGNFHKANLKTYLGIEGYTIFSGRLGKFQGKKQESSWGIKDILEVVHFQLCCVRYEDWGNVNKPVQTAFH